MRLISLSVRDFRCFRELTNIPLHSLTVFIGENDAGKTAIVDALERLLTAKTFDANDVRRSPNPGPSNYEVGGSFVLEDGEAPPNEWLSPEGHITLRKTFAQNGVTLQLLGKGFPDPRHNSFATLTADPQKEVLAALEYTPGSNAAARVAQFADAVQRGKLVRTEMWIDVTFAQIAGYLPRFERIASVDYRQPDALVNRVVQAVVDDALRPVSPDTGQRVSISSLAPLQETIFAALEGKSEEMADYLRRYNDTISKVSIQPRIDFSKAVVSSSLMLDTGTGLSPVGTHGEGSKKKLWMGLLEWERSSNTALAGLSTIRAYDEPDVNLDYTAERHLFAGILQATQVHGSRTQAVVCTHAMTLVDRARKDSINLIRVGEDGERSIDFLSGDGDEDMAAFLQTLGTAVGVTNSSLFYERAFMLVEGESEELALPILYRNLYGSSMLEDGLVLVNLHSCGAWKGILKVFLKNRSDVTVILMDEDCKLPLSSGYITTANLTAIGYPESFQQSSCFYVGTKEFEDAFATEDIVATLNVHWPKVGEAWTVEQVNELKTTSSKFSEDLMSTVRQSCEIVRRADARKPAFAAKLSEHCVAREQIPFAVLAAFALARQKAGL